MRTRTGRRRRVLSRLVPSGVIVAIAATVALAVSLWVRSADPGPGWIRAASVSELEEQGVIYVAPAHAYVVALASGAPLALYARSPHRGERVRYCGSSGWFEDRAHGAMFDGLGRYVLGPAPRGLDRFDVRIVDGDVWVNTNNLFLGPSRGEEQTEPPSGPFCVHG